MEAGTFYFDLSLTALGGILIIGIILIFVIAILARNGGRINKTDGIIIGQKMDVNLVNDMYKSVKKIETKLSIVERDILRLNLISTENPIEERLDAGKRYTDDGGNGAASVLYNKLKSDYKESLE